MPLTDSAIRALKARDKPYKVADEKGLYLLSEPFRGPLVEGEIPRRQGGVERKLSLGSAIRKSA